MAAFALVGAACSSQPEEKSDLRDYRTEPYVVPSGREDLRTGELILECEKHLRAWQTASTKPLTEESKEEVQFLEQAMAILVHREQARLEEQAVSGPPRNRGVASAALAFSSEAPALTLMMNNVLDLHPQVSANALLGVGILASPETPLEPLYEVAMRPDKDPMVVRNLAYAGFQLARILNSDPKGQLSSIFIPLLSFHESGVRAQAAAGLGLTNAAHAIPLLADSLGNDDDPAVRTAAALALGNIGAPGATEALVQALDDPHPVTSGTARGSLVKIHGEDLGGDSSDWSGLLENR